MKSEWFSVDRDGLAKQLADVPTWRLVAELIQNAWDERSTQVHVYVLPGQSGFTRIIVEDDNPTGFADLTHAWTLFAPSQKAGKADKRGRFNMGEKLLLSVATQAQIETTTGTVIFDRGGRRKSRQKTEAGSRITVDLKLSKDDAKAMVRDLRRLIPPIPTLLTGGQLTVPPKLADFWATLPTVTVDEAGQFMRTRRQTQVNIYRADGDRPAAIYELGIPVVATDMPWLIDVQQKVPLNRDRDNVTPAYLQELRVQVLNTMHDVMAPEQFREDWARAAAGDEDASPDAVEESLDARFGQKRVAYDPNDPEANRLATAAGYTVVPGGSMSKGEWRNARTTTLPAGQVTPSPRPYHPDGKPLVPMTDLTQGMHDVKALAVSLASRIGIGGITVTFTDDPGWGFKATFGESRNLVLNVGALGRAWFDVVQNRVPMLDLLIHELAHYDGANHLEERYWRNLSRIGAQLADLALAEPDVFRGPLALARPAAEPNRTKDLGVDDAE